MIKLTETREITPYRWVHPDRGSSTPSVLEWASFIFYSPAAASIAV
jgi:hypothetical protein